MRRWPTALLALLAALVAMAVVPVASHAACTNAICTENAQTGVNDWQIDGPGDTTIQGFATSMSVDKGQAISFKIKATSSNYKVRILRLGYYGGDGARAIATNLSPTGPSTQPACNSDANTGLIDCGNWSVSLSWTVPSTAVSGVYLADLQLSNGDESQIPFVVRDDSSHSDIVVQTSDETWEAYNTYGGNSLYTCGAVCPPGNPKAYKAAFKVSYNRPFMTEQDSPGSALFRGSEYSMIRFLEQSGYDVSYISGADTATRPALLTNHKIFMSSGHDEYWSGPQRAAVEAARDAGVNLTFFSGNEMFWRTRFEAGASNTANRTLVAYKDTHFDAATDPVSWTGTYYDPRFTTDADGVKPQNAVTGTSFLINAGTSNLTVAPEYAHLRLWRNTQAANLTAGQTPLALGASTLGYEWDVDPDNGYRAPGAFRLSSTTVAGLDAFVDYGSTIQGNSTATHNLMMYRAPSGALVFGAGTVQWAWGLSDWNGIGSQPNRNMQQATLNLFADMGVQPSLLLTGLQVAAKSTDTSAPTSTITSPPATVADGTTITLNGTATDTGGGVVAGVEVSTDGGSTWHPATGTANWSYSWTAHGNPSTTIKTRAVDDSGNLQTPGAGVTVNVTCSCSLFATTIPSVADSGDNTPVEVGVKFKSDTFGKITGVRFYKAATNTGTHTGSLWSASGTRLAQATFSNETGSGWQTVTFATPVEIQPGTTYVASYYAPAGHYSATGNYFYRSPAPDSKGGAIADSPPLHALRNSGSTGNGVYSYGSASTFPSNSFSAGNYWVDVLFAPIPAPGTVTNVTAVEGGSTSANVSWTAPSSGGAATSYVVTPYVGSTAQTPKTVTGSPLATNTTVTGLTTGTTYTFRVQAVNPAGSGPQSAASNAVTPLTAVVPGPPGAVSAQPASKSARVTWTAPDADGDSAITGYTITPYVGSSAQTPATVGASARTTTVTGLTNGTIYTFRVAATNGVGTGASTASSAVTPEATIFDFSTPTVDDSSDADAAELGVKFKADFDGSITGIRFYKSAANTGTHSGSLWSAAGTRLAQATFTNETATGWQTVTFGSPVAVTAGTTYVASYFTSTGHYSYTDNGFASSGVDNAPLHALPNATSPNGVYTYGTASSFPSSTFHAANYWVDVLYAIPSPGQVSGVTATAARRAADLSWTAPSGGGPVTSYEITPYVGSAAQTPTTTAGTATSKRVTGLTSGTTYTFTVRAVNANGPGPASAQSNAVTPLAAVVPAAPAGVAAQPASGSVRVTWTDPDNDSGSDLTGHTVTPYVGSTAQTPVQVSGSATSATVSGLTNGTSYTFRVTATNGVGTGAASDPSGAATPQATIFDFATPATLDSGDTSPVVLGVKFRSDADGSVTGIRFYKAAANTGTHVGSLWSASGTRLAQATFAGESASGWQSVTFDSPVAITPNTTYVASYSAGGHYSVTSGGLASGADNPPLHALANSSSPNGVYAYGGSASFPSSSFNAGDYGVDVLFAPVPAPGTVTNVTATAGVKSASVSWSAPSTGGPVTSYRITPYIGSTAQTATTITGSPPATTATITGLTAGTAYKFTVRAANSNGSGPESAQSSSVTPTAPQPPAAPTGVSAQGATSSARVTWAQASSDSAITQYTVTPYIGSSSQTSVQVGGSATAATVTGLTNGTSYTFKVTATNDAGTSPASAASNAVIAQPTIFDFATPATVDAGDNGSVVLGVKFSSDVAGSITGIRFYKASANTGTHVGALWSAGGQLLGQGTFAGETASGWQSVTFASSVAITANTTYVATYLAPNGRYSVTGAAFASNPADNPPLHALANGTSPNGVYLYGSAMAFPTGSFNATNYWVDVLFTPAS